MFENPSPVSGPSMHFQDQSCQISKFQYNFGTVSSNGRPEPRGQSPGQTPGPAGPKGPEDLGE